MTNTDHAAAWHRFWNGQPRGGGASGCLPARWAPIDAAQAKAWAQFAEQLPTGARVLDLATGDGRVLAMLRRGRPDIEGVGVDFAPRLPAPPPGVALHGGVRMEELPFGDDSFTAVTSQFGFEYGNVAATAVEIARVVRSDGLIGLLVHRGDGPILAHNLARSEQIDFALSGPVIEQADLSPDRYEATLRDCTDRVRAAVERFGEGGVAWEIAEAFRRSILIVPDLGPDQAGIALSRISEEASGERARIASLAAACVAADDREGLHAAFEAAHLELVSRTSVTAEEKAFADMLILRPR